MSQTSTKPIEMPAKRWTFPRLSAGHFGTAILLLIALPCILSLPWAASKYDIQVFQARQAPTLNPASVLQAEASDSTYSPGMFDMIMGSDTLGRSVFWRCMLGGAISLGIGTAAALISVIIGVLWGAMSGLAGGRTDAAMMRTVDILYGLPYILLVVLVKIAMEPQVTSLLMSIFSSESMVEGKKVVTGMEQTTAVTIASIITLLVAIGGVSWLTMSRVIRGQVLSLRELPFVEAARACGVKSGRILRVHLLPNLVGPIVVYTTLTVPTAILQESFLSFLGIGVQPPLPSWGNLASDGIKELHALSLEGTSFKWWILVWPCLLLGMTLMALNFLGEALRNRVDPRSVKKN